MSGLTPKELDQLEDVLEHLGDDAALEELQLGEALSEKLDAYQNVVALTSQAWPQEDMPEGLLANVMAEAARSDVVKLGAQTEEEAGEEKVAWYARLLRNWRKTLMPAMTTVAVAGLVFWVVEQNESELAPSAADHETEFRAGPAQQKNDQGVMAAPMPVELQEGRADKGNDALSYLGRRERDQKEAIATGAKLEKTIVKESAPSRLRPAIAPSSRSVGSQPKKAKRKKSSSPFDDFASSDPIPGGVVGGVVGGSSSGNPKPAKPSPSAQSTPAPPPSPEAKQKSKKDAAPEEEFEQKEYEPLADADDLGSGGSGESSSKKSSKNRHTSPKYTLMASILARGDDQRRAGNCDDAKSTYRQAMKGTATERAHAEAGLGLCFEREGKQSKANRHFKRAISVRSSLKSWIERERKYN